MNPHVCLTLFWLKYEYAKQKQAHIIHLIPFLLVPDFQQSRVMRRTVPFCFYISLIVIKVADQGISYPTEWIIWKCSFLKYNHWERHLLFLTLAPLPLCLSFSWFRLAIYESNGHDSGKREEAPHRAQICCGMTREVEWGAFYTEQIVLLLTQE